MDHLILDIKIHIASFNDEAWYAIYKLDSEFRKYTHTETGRKKYKEIATKITPTDPIEYTLFGKYHRENDQPAIIRADGTKEWWYNGNCHRENDQPAIIYADGTKEWWHNGNRHRENDQPSVIYAKGSKSWWHNGNRHRENDQPAVINENGTKEWWKDGIKYN